MTIDGRTRAKRRNGKKRMGSNSSRQPSILEGVSNAGHKPLSRTITIRAINLSFGPVTRIMRAARVSASITFEILHRLSVSPYSSCRAHARYIFLFTCRPFRASHLVGIYFKDIIQLVIDFVNNLL